MRRILSVLVAAMLIMGSVAISGAEEAAPEAAPAPPPAPAVTAKNVGDVVPEWTGTNLVDNAVVKGSSLKGKPYALLFVNSACSACRAEMTDLNKLDFGDNLNMMLVSIDANVGRAVKVYKGRFGIKFPILDDSSQAISSMFGFYFSPAAVIVDQDGKVSQQFSGYAPSVKEEVLSAFKKYAN